MFNFILCQLYSIKIEPKYLPPPINLTVDSMPILMSNNSIFARYFTMVDKIIITKEKMNDFLLIH